MLEMRLDATHTYKGYRQQALYVLWRILNDTDELTYQPEGLEDLAVFNGDGILVEVTQVKAHSSNITLTTFDPQNHSGFFNRVHDYLEVYSNLEVNIVSFGSYGNSLYQALISDGAERAQVSKQLSAYENLSLSEAEHVLASIQPIQVSEQELQDSINSQLKDSLLGEPTTAFDMLSYWIYICSEHKHQISKQDVLTKMNQIGQFINERAAHHREWFTSIVPLRDQTIESELRIALKKRFYEGVSARYEHILADLDVSRPQKLQQIHESFENNDVVIIHGISGQGKTTLAFRYLHEYLPDQWRFFIHSPENRSHALSIATAIAHHAQVMNTPLVVYLDVKPSDTDWTETVRELAFVPNIKILVTIREDDLRRASFSAVDFPYTTIELQLSVGEAEEIYAQFVSTKQPTEFTDFESAWTRFGIENQGPLMEFIYLITQGTSLRDRLFQQIKALEDEVAIDNLDERILHLLRVVSIASAFGARLQRLCLAKALSLKVPKRLIERLEKEYLVKLDDEQLLIDGVHPIRSTIIKDLLVNEYTSWTEDIQLCLNCIYEPDLATFLLELFVRESEQINDLVQTLTTYYPKTWTGVAGITQSLVWLGIKRFIDQNIHVLDKAYALFGKAGTMLLNPDIAGAMPESGNLVDKLGEFLPREAVEQAKELQSNLEGIDELFTYTTTWLNNMSSLPHNPETISDWNGLAESIFWLHHLHISTSEWISEIDFNSAIPKLPLDVVANIASAFAHTQGVSNWHMQNHHLLLEHFKKTTNTVCIEIIEKTVKLHYIFDIQTTNRKDGLPDPIHHASLQRLRWFADLFPEYDVIGIQGYGHRIVATETLDTSYKNVDRKHLPSKRLVWINSVYSGLFYWKYRPLGWQEYTDEIMSLRREIVRLLTEYERGIEKYFQRKTPVNLLSKISNRQSIINKLTKNPLLPQSAVDPWGITKESSQTNSHEQREQQRATQNEDNNSAHLLTHPKGVLLSKFTTYWKSVQSYTSSLSNFFNQSQHALIITERIRILDEQQLGKVLQAGAQHGLQPRLIGLSVTNLFDAKSRLLSFQIEFRRLLLPFVDERMLSQLERQEIKVYERL